MFQLLNETPMIVFQMANNHMGDIQHAKRIINEFSCFIQKFPQLRFAFKFQMRNLDTFIHKDYQARNDLKYVKRFKQTRLNYKQFEQLELLARDHGFITMCTAFDQQSVDIILEIGFDILKIASCSFTDWPLLNKIVDECEGTDGVIASTGGATMNDIDRVFSFFKHRDIQFALMHCIGEYPTQQGHMQLNQIDFLKNRYPGIPVGFSTHESPKCVSAAVAAACKGACIFEKHVGIETQKYKLNDYSADLYDTEQWLKSIVLAIQICGVKNRRHSPSYKQIIDLRQFKRGVFLNRDVKVGQIIDRRDVYYAWPNVDCQLLANDMGKYIKYKIVNDLKADAPLLVQHTCKINSEEKILKIVKDVSKFIIDAGIKIPNGTQMQISHHYDIDRFYQTGLTMFTIVNEQYCKKILVSLPNQTHPEQYHKLKKETFIVLYGNPNITLVENGNSRQHSLKPGDVLTVQPGVVHSWTSTTGCIMQEVSTTHDKADSFYNVISINYNQNRKTIVRYWNQIYEY